MKSGLSIHCHHDSLMEYCYDYDERVAVIKRDKPENEQEMRLRLFKLLSPGAIADLPVRLVKAYAEWEKADAEWEKADAEREKADAEREKADAEWEKAYAEWKKVCAEWGKADREIWHKKWCNCQNWTGSEIDFNK